MVKRERRNQLPTFKNKGFMVLRDTYEVTSPAGCNMFKLLHQAPSTCVRLRQHSRRD